MNSLKKKIVASLLLAGMNGSCLVSQAHASSFIQDDLQTWQIGVVRGHITRRILGYLDVQNNEVNLSNKIGQSNGKNHEGQLLVRPALGFQVNKYISIWQGYGWTPAFQPQFRNENQIWEQVLIEKKFERFSVTNRTRLEIRKIADANGTAVRLRNQFRVAVPLNKRWSLVTYDEPFFNFNTVQNGPRKGFNQNWLFAGINRKLTDNLSMEVGYLNNYVRNFAPAPNRMNHVIMIGMNYSFGTKGGIDLRRSLPKKQNHLSLASTSLDSQGPLLENSLASEQPSTSSNNQEELTKTAVDNQPDLEIMPIQKATPTEEKDLQADHNG